LATFLGAFFCTFFLATGFFLAFLGAFFFTGEAAFFLVFFALLFFFPAMRRTP
jgi:hypothetical protein